MSGELLNGHAGVPIPLLREVINELVWEHSCSGPIVDRLCAIYIEATGLPDVPPTDEPLPPEDCVAGTCRHMECARQRVAARRAARRQALTDG